MRLESAQERPWVVGKHPVPVRSHHRFPHFRENLLGVCAPLGAVLAQLENAQQVLEENGLVREEQVQHAPFVVRKQSQKCVEQL